MEVDCDKDMGEGATKMEVAKESESDKTDKCLANLSSGVKPQTGQSLSSLISFSRYNF